MSIRSTLTIVGLLVGLSVSYGLEAVVPGGGVLMFWVLFLAMKPLAGLRTWWHAIAGASLASYLWIAVSDPPMVSSPSDAFVVLFVAPILVIVSAFSMLKIMLHERGRRRLS